MIKELLKSALIILVCVVLAIVFTNKPVDLPQPPSIEIGKLKFNNTIVRLKAHTSVCKECDPHEDPDFGPVFTPCDKYYEIMESGMVHGDWVFIPSHKPSWQYKRIIDGYDWSDGKWEKK